MLKEILWKFINFCQLENVLKLKLSLDLKTTLFSFQLLNNKEIESPESLENYSCQKF